MPEPSEKYFELSERISVLDAKLEALQIAIARQDIEIERRLHELNNAAATRTQQELEDRGRFLRFDIFDAKHNQLMTDVDARIGKVSDRLSLVERWRAQVVGMAIGVALGSALITALIMRLIGK